MTPTHTLHVIGISVDGAAYRLDCDDPEACAAAARAIDGPDADPCHLRTWWEECTTDLIPRDIVGPPPWRLAAQWWGGDGPELVPAKEEA